MSYDELPSAGEMAQAAVITFFPLIDPALIEKAAEEYDCLGEGSFCRHFVEETDEQFAYCRVAMFRGHYCKNDIAEVLRGAAKYIRQQSIEKPAKPMESPKGA